MSTLEEKLQDKADEQKFNDMAAKAQVKAKERHDKMYDKATKRYNEIFGTGVLGKLYTMNKWFLLLTLACLTFTFYAWDAYINYRLNAIDFGKGFSYLGFISSTQLFYMLIMQSRTSNFKRLMDSEEFMALSRSYMSLQTEQLFTSVEGRRMAKVVALIKGCLKGAFFEYERESDGKDVFRFNHPNDKEEHFEIALSKSEQAWADKRVKIVHTKPTEVDTEQPTVQ